MDILSSIAASIVVGSITFNIGVAVGERRVEIQAIAKGHAEYVLNAQTGKVTWQWKEEK